MRFCQSGYKHAIPGLRCHWRLSERRSCCPWSSTRSTQNQRRCSGILKGAQAPPWSLTRPYTDGHPQSFRPGASSSVLFYPLAVPPRLLHSAFLGSWARGVSLPVAFPACMAHSLHARLPLTRPRLCVVILLAFCPSPPGHGSNRPLQPSQARRLGHLARAEMVVKKCAALGSGILGE